MGDVVLKMNPRKVTDGGGQFYSAAALQLHDMLGIRKERIDPGEPWMNYAETLLYVTWNYLRGTIAAVSQMVQHLRVGQLTKLIRGLLPVLQEKTH